MEVVLHIASVVIKGDRAGMSLHHRPIEPKAILNPHAPRIVLPPVLISLQAEFGVV